MQPVVSQPVITNSSQNIGSSSASINSHSKQHELTRSFSQVIEDMSQRLESASPLEEPEVSSSSTQPQQQAQPPNFGLTFPRIQNPFTNNISLPSVPKPAGGSLLKNVSLPSPPGSASSSSASNNVNVNNNFQVNDHGNLATDSKTSKEVSSKASSSSSNPSNNLLYTNPGQNDDKSESRPTTEQHISGLQLEEAPKVTTGTFSFYNDNNTGSTGTGTVFQPAKTTSENQNEIELNTALKLAHQLTQLRNRERNLVAQELVTLPNSINGNQIQESLRLVRAEIARVEEKATAVVKGHAKSPWDNDYTPAKPDDLFNEANEQSLSKGTNLGDRNNGYQQDNSTGNLQVPSLQVGSNTSTHMINFGGIQTGIRSDLPLPQNTNSVLKASPLSMNGISMNGITPRGQSPPGQIIEEKQISFSVQLSRRHPEQRLGIVNVPVTNDGTLLIKKIDSTGLLAEHNAREESLFPKNSLTILGDIRGQGDTMKNRCTVVNAGDVITSVNGITKNILAMRRELQTSQVVHLVISRTVEVSKPSPTTAAHPQSSPPQEETVFNPIIHPTNEDTLNRMSPTSLAKRVKQLENHLLNVNMNSSSRSATPIGTRFSTTPISRRSLTPKGFGVGPSLSVGRFFPPTGSLPSRPNLPNLMHYHSLTSHIKPHQYSSTGSSLGGAASAINLKATLSQQDNSKPVSPRRELSPPQLGAMPTSKSLGGSMSSSSMDPHSMFYGGSQAPGIFGSSMTPKLGMTNSLGGVKLGGFGNRLPGSPSPTKKLNVDMRAIQLELRQNNELLRRQTEALAGFQMDLQNVQNVFSTTNGNQLPTSSNSPKAKPFSDQVAELQRKGLQKMMSRQKSFDNSPPLQILQNTQRLLENERGRDPSSSDAPRSSAANEVPQGENDYNEVEYEEQVRSGSGYSSNEGLQDVIQEGQQPQAIQEEDLLNFKDSSEEDNNDNQEFVPPGK